MERGTNDHPVFLESFSEVLEDKVKELRRAHKVSESIVPVTIDTLPAWFKEQHNTHIAPLVGALHAELIHIVVSNNDISKNSEFVDIWVKGPEIITYGNGLTSYMSAFNIQLFNASGDERNVAREKLRKLNSYLPLSEDDDDLRDRMKAVYEEFNFGIAIGEYEFSLTPPMPEFNGKRADSVRFASGSFGINEKASKTVLYRDNFITDQQNDGMYDLAWWNEFSTNDERLEAIEESYLELAHTYATLIKFLEWARYMRTDRTEVLGTPLPY